MTIEIYRFGAGEASNIGAMQPVEYLGGKGAHLQVMASLGVPVPPGFTIPTKHCVAYMEELTPAAKQAMVAQAAEKAVEGMKWLTDSTGYTPLVSVRSGAPVSMPGMMDTILNVGLCDANLAEWASRIGVWAAVDSYRRLMQMLGSTAAGIPHHEFEAVMAAARKSAKVETDRELKVEDLAAVVDKYRVIWVKHGEGGLGFPQDPADQLRMAIAAVWESWGNERARVYRDMHKIPHEMGTAVTVQAMVFGNMNDQSGSGVMFSRNPMTGERSIVGEFLPCAQGEDVVAGIRTPLPISEMVKSWPEVTEDLFEIADMLEQHYGDVQDIEFTVQNGELFLLQTRSAKRSALASVVLAVDMAKEGLIDEKAMLKRVTPTQFVTARRPVVDPKAKNPLLATGLPACPGVGIGVVATSSDQAVTLAAQGYDVILVTDETTPDDIKGMVASKGILTRTGGATSHAAVVARALDKPCIVGCQDLAVLANAISFPGVNLPAGTKSVISLDGLSGRVFQDPVPVLSATDDPRMAVLEEAVLDGDGSILRSGSALRVAGGQVTGYLIAADWLYDDSRAMMTGVAKKLAEADVITSERRVFIDLTKPTALVDPVDLRLSKTCGKHLLGRAEVAWGQGIVAALMEDPTRYTGVVLLNCDWLDPASRTKLSEAGVRFVAEPKTLADLLSGNPVIMTDDFVTNVVGGKAAWTKLQGALKTMGVTSQAFEQPKHATVEEAAFRVLG